MSEGNGHIPLNGNGAKQAKKPKKQKWAGRPTDKILDERVAEMTAILAAKPNIHRCQLHKLLTARWNCHWRTVDRIEVRARTTLLERTNRPRDMWVCDVLAAYEKEVTSDKPGIRLSALSGIRELLGLDAPRRTEISGPNGTPVRIESSANSQRLAAVVLEEIEARVKLGLKLNGNGTGLLAHETPVIDVEAKPGGNGGNGNGHHEP